ncbi:CDP-glycerol glycerophosphotransferase family protein [Psychrobacter sp. 4Bb]|uniref:CDP-glycerol glycerophosphotransferase family protein n=1 Tax=Psychrobacter sp. 4Bb TaxID=888436 RepID=UPI0015E0B395|nr:CDP-glycerol glycerophosphotransferase family protein [Psychrobacter sp. 4Bb]
MDFKKIIDIAYSSAIFVASLAANNNESWLFGAQGGYSYSDNAKYFFEWILDNHEQEQCFWVTKDKEIYKDLLSKELPVLYFYDIKNILSIAKAKYIVCTHSHTGNDIYKFINKSKVLITLWHGIPLKKMGKASQRKYLNYLNIKNTPDLFLVTSVKDAELFSELYHISIDKFFIGTYPRVNNLISRAEDNNTILYAPTFRDGMGQDYYDKNIFPSTNELENLNEMLVKFDYHFLIKMHPYVDASFPSLTNYSNINIIPAFEDVQDALSKASVLITDYSSIYFDYLNLDREIIFFIPDYEWYYQESNRGLLYNYEDVTPGYKAKSWNEIQNSLAEIFKGNKPSEFAESRSKILNMFFSKKNLNNDDLFNKCKSINYNN